MTVRAALRCAIFFFMVAGVIMVKNACAFVYINNAHPLFIGIGSPAALSAEPENALRININYSSTYLVESSNNWRAGIDLETTLAELVGSVAFSDRSEARFRVPVISYNSGFLDGPLEWYHNTFGFPDYGRSYRPQNEFLYTMTRNGTEVIHGETGGAGLGDVSLGVKQVLFRGTAVISTYGFVEFPTGDPKEGYGNGSLDYGIMLLADIPLGRRVKGYLNAGYVFPGTWKAQEDVHLREYQFGALGLEWNATKTVSSTLQLTMQTSPYDTGIREIDTMSAVLVLGGAYVPDRRVSMELSFAEDINIAGTPDFMVNIGCKYHY